MPAPSGLTTNQSFSEVATIAASGSLSGAIELAGYSLGMIMMPAAWTAAALTFQASYDGTTYNNVHNEAGTELSYTVAANRAILLNPAVFAGARYIKLRSGTGATPVVQVAQALITLAIVPYR